MSINKNSFNNNTIYTHLLGPGKGSFFLPAGIAKVTRKSITIFACLISFSLLILICFILLIIEKHSYIPLQCSGLCQNGFHIYIHNQQQN